MQGSLETSDIIVSLLIGFSSLGGLATHIMLLLAMRALDIYCSVFVYNTTEPHRLIVKRKLI